MVGPLNSPGVQVPGVSGAAPSAEPVGGIRGFLATTLGKLVVGGIILLVIVGALAVIAVFFLFSGDGEGELTLPVTGSTVTSSTAESEVPPSQRRDPDLEDYFSFRNIFGPTVKPAIPASSSVDGTGAPGEVAPDVLFLQGVAMVDGEPKGTFLWNGTTFIAGEGETLAGTPWKVLSIEGNTVVMLFGDSRVTLVVGQGSAK